MRIRIGTSGYSYNWNEGKPTPFEWYVNQGFDTVEVNASFYRFPSSRWVDTWLKAPNGFTFSIKVNRAITHYCRLRGEARDLWGKFREQLARMDERIAFYHPWEILEDKRADCWRGVSRRWRCNTID